MLGTTPNLKLALFQNMEDGWAAGMNANLQKIDTELTSAVNKMTDRARAVENNLALRISEFLQLINASNQSYVSDLVETENNAVTAIKTYIDSILTPAIARAEANQTAILSGITTERARLDQLERKIENSFVDAHTYIESLFTELSNEVSSNMTVIINMRDNLQTLLNRLATEINEHINDYENPHQVTFDQAGGQESFVYVKDPIRDAYYSPR